MANFEWLYEINCYQVQYKQNRTEHAESLNVIYMQVHISGKKLFTFT